MRRGAHPVPDFEDPVNDCASGAAAGGPEGCPFIDPAPGDWFILIDAFSAYDEWTLRAWYEEGPSGLNIGVRRLDRPFSLGVGRDGGRRRPVGGYPP